MSPLAWTYAAYLVCSGVVAVWVGQTLHYYGRAYLIDTFRGNTRVADAVNHLLLVGFYLVNLAFVTLTLKTGLTVIGWQDGVELLSQKLGIVMTVLGVWHFKNMVVCHVVRGYWKASTARVADDSPVSREALPGDLCL